MADLFRFKQFSVRNETSALKVGTDAVLLGAAMTVLPEDRHALDIGTGTGVIALMAAQRSTMLDITGIDIDKGSAGEAAHNFAISPWSGRLNARLCALQDFVPDAEYDLIFTNPPYYDNSLRNPDAREADARHCGTLGFGDIFRFASQWLKPDGRLSMIMPSDCGKSSCRLAVSYGIRPYRTIRIRTTATKPVKRLIIEFSKTQMTVSEEDITLMENGGRSREYSELTKDFYL